MKFNKKKGFTLVELLVVIAILAILSTVAVVGYSKFIDKAVQSNDGNLLKELNRNLDYDQVENNLKFDNIRELDIWLRSRGIDELNTSDDTKAILYNKETNEFELVDNAFMSEGNKKSSKRFGKAKAASYEITKDAFYVEDAITGYIVASDNNLIGNIGKTLENVQVGYDNTNFLPVEFRGPYESIYKDYYQNTIVFVEENKVLSFNSLDGFIEGIDSSALRGYFDDSKFRRVHFKEGLELANIDSILNFSAPQCLSKTFVVNVPKDMKRIDATSDKKMNVVIAGNTKAVSSKVRLQATVIDNQEDAKEIFLGNFLYANVHTFDELKAALDSTAAKKFITIKSSFAITSNIKIDKNTEVKMPYDYNEQTGEDNFYRKDMTNNGDQVTNSSLDELNIPATTPEKSNDLNTNAILTINPGVKITLEGKLLVGGLTGVQGNNNIGGHTSGKYAQISNNGTIELTTAEANLDVYGYIKGTGVINQKAGATSAPIILNGLLGGQNSANFASYKRSPFNGFSFANIQNAYTISGGDLIGKVGIGTAEVNTTLVSYEQAKNAFVTLNAGATIKFEYDPTKAIKKYNPSENLTDPAVAKEKDFDRVGRTVITITGGATTNTISLVIEEIEMNSKEILLPISYNVSIIFKNGVYDLNANLALMPGAELEVCSDATLNIKENSGLFVLHGLKQEALSGITYPVEKLNTPELKNYANFKMNGILNVLANGSLGGLVNTTVAGATINITEGAKLGNKEAFVLPQVDMSVEGDPYKGLQDYSNTFVSLGGVGKYGSNLTMIDLDCYLAIQNQDNSLATINLSNETISGTVTYKSANLTSIENGNVTVTSNIVRSEELYNTQAHKGVDATPEQIKEFEAMPNYYYIDFTFKKAKSYHKLVNDVITNEINITKVFAKEVQ